MDSPPRGRAPRRGQQLATAFHEAGHAVVAVWEGEPLKYATIVPKEGSAGHVRHTRGLRLRGGEPSRKSAERRARICLAGPIAQHRFNPRSMRRYHAHGDHQTAADLALTLAGSAKEAGAWLRLWEIQVQQMLDLRWAALQRVAAALLERGTVSGEEVERLVCGPVRPRHPLSDLPPTAPGNRHDLADEGPPVGYV